MLINQPNLEAAYYSFNALFQEGWQYAKPWWSNLATEQPSTTAENRYYWWGQIPKFREWIGERTLISLSNRVWPVINKDWELTLKLPRNAFLDDQLGTFRDQIKNIGYQGSKLPDDLVLATILAGTTTTCWDGQFFFDTDHPVDFDDSSKGTWGNNYPTTAFTPANIGIIRAAMRAIPAEDGRAMGIIPNLMVVAPALEMAARQMLFGTIISPTGAFGINVSGGMQDNAVRGMFDLLVINELAGVADDVYFLLDTTKPVKPFLYQNRQAVTTTPLVSPSDPNLFFRKEYIYGADARANASFALPHLIARGKVA
jgi:phage major head subunit gpT-like protein